LLLALLATSAPFAAWDKCKFQFGRGWTGAGTYTDVDYVTIWVGDGSSKNNQYNTYWEGAMLKACKSQNLTPVFYSYIIAFLARNKGGLGDCDISGSNNLCTGGAKYIRDNRALILSTYEAFARGAAADYGTSSPMVWLLEPDFYQYAQPGNQGGNPLSTADAASLITDIVAAIRKSLPNAILSFDISPWMGNSNWSSAETAWWNAMPKSSFTYRNTSGGRTHGDNARIRTDASNNATWAGVKQLTGLGVIADDGYGAGGGSNGDWTEWMTASNLNARIADGVVALSVPEPGGDYGSKISGLRSQLNKPFTCGGTPTTPSKFALTLSMATGGTLSASPVQPTGGYDSNTTVGVTATPSTGYKFSGWTGACSGTGTCSVTMNAAKTVGATFAVNATWTLTVQTSADSGSVTLSPSSTTYADGAVVTATAVPKAGMAFTGWTGACTGTGACSVTMNANKTLAAHWSAVAWTLTSTATNGSIVANPAGTSFANGTSVKLTARPQAGYKFTSWSGDCSGSDTVCTLTMTSNKSVAATFAQIPTRTISLTATNGSVVFVPAGPNFLEGAIVTATATPNTGFRFVGWQGACSGTGACSMTIPNYNLTLTAQFEPTSAVSDRLGNVRFATVVGNTLHLASGTRETLRCSVLGLDGRSEAILWNGAQDGFLTLDLGTLPRGLHVLSVQGSKTHRTELIRVGL